mmetsp:Transcript_26701/g.67105  ORF Transcript_26701/g.67105 Transcript_26701/m.67105 type:complete len:80 (-) Transcript_26701:97-336(-)
MRRVCGDRGGAGGTGGGDHASAALADHVRLGQLRGARALQSENDRTTSCADALNKRLVCVPPRAGGACRAEGFGTRLYS